MHSGQDPLGTWRFFWFAVACLVLTFTVASYVEGIADELRLTGFVAAAAYPLGSAAYTLGRRVVESRSAQRGRKQR